MTGTRREALAERRAAVLQKISDASARAGRDPASVTLVAVSKTVSTADLVDAVAAGLDRLGENRVQEGVAKAPLVPGATWELVGPLQSNKARRALETFARIQSLGSVELAERLARIAGELERRLPYPVLLQVNVDDDAGKAGFEPSDLARDLGAIVRLPNLSVEGLMTIGRFATDPEGARPTFRALRVLSQRLRDAEPSLGPELSMGMSHDYPIAIEEGATIVRVGRALFGERPTTAAAPRSRC